VVFNAAAVSRPRKLHRKAMMLARMMGALLLRRGSTFRTANSMPRAPMSKMWLKISRSRW